MLIWGIFWGAVIGLVSSDFRGYGAWLGAFLGFFGGFSLRWVVRQELLKTPTARESAAHPGSAGETPAASMSLQSATLAPSKFPPAGEPSTVRSTASVAPSAARNEVAAAQPSDEEQAQNARIPAGYQPASAQIPQRLQEPSQPGAPELALLAIKNWFLGGNTIVRVGLVILFIGLSFLARFAASAGMFPVEFRLGAVGTAAIVLLAIGFRKRHDRPGFALALQGAGVAAMYLTVFAAFRLYALLPPLAAFSLMIVVCALGCALALLQNSRALAVAAFAGGFAVPLLLSTGQGSHVGLFSYFLMLNTAILFIAYRRSWRILNVVGFIATFGVATAWGVLSYRPEQYASTQPFLICFVLIYLFTAVLYARNTPTKLGSAVDTILVFGTPLIGFGLQAGLVRQFELGTAFSALAFAALYLGVATLLMRRAQENYRLLIECLMAIGVGFLTLAIPLALDARWTSAVWALQGAGAFWVGMRQARWMPRAFGLVMQLVAALVYLQTIQAPDANVSAWPFANPVFMGALFIALPAFALAWWLRKPLPHSESRWAKTYAALEIRLASPVYLYAFGFWCLAWVNEINRTLPATMPNAMPQQVFDASTTPLLVMLAIVASAALSLRLGRLKSWPVATWPSYATVVVMALTLVVQSAGDNRVLHTPAWAIWLVVLMLHYAMLHQNDAMAAVAAPAPKGAAPGLPIRGIHVCSIWLVILLIADCLWFWIGKGNLWHTSWAGVVLLISNVLALMLLAAWAGRANQSARLARFSWPLDPHAAAYYWSAARPIAALVFAGALLVAVLSSGRTDPLPYIPLLNPTDLTLALALGALVFWRRVVLEANPGPVNAHWLRGTSTLAAFAALTFIAVNTVWLRIAHHFFGVPWDSGALFDSFVVQTGYAILWTLLALGLMVMAHRRAHRPLWLTGAGLLVLVVVKLLLIDLSNAGGAERIIAFIAVGVLMLMVGYFAPLPPKAGPKGLAAGWPKTSPAELSGAPA